MNDKDGQVWIDLIRSARKFRENPTQQNRQEYRRAIEASDRFQEKEQLYEAIKQNSMRTARLATSATFVGLLIIVLVSLFLLRGPIEAYLTQNIISTIQADGEINPNQGIVSVTVFRLRDRPVFGDFEDVITLEEGTLVDIIGRLPDNSWFYVQTENGPAWIPDPAITVPGIIEEIPRVDRNGNSLEGESEIDSVSTNENTIYSEVTSLSTETGTNLSYIAIAFQQIDSDLQSVLNDPDRELTLFAPTDRAFENILALMGMDFFTNVGGDANLISQIMRYHIVPERLTPEELQTMQSENIQTLDSEFSLRISTDEQTIFVEGATIISEPIQTQNGTIYIIDRIITNPSLLESVLPSLPTVGGENNDED